MNRTEVPLKSWMPWLVVVAAIAVYANSLANGFAYDDVWIIQNNARVHGLGDQHGIWLEPYWPTAGYILGLWRPIAIFGYAVQWTLSDGAPWLFHAVSVLLHAGVSLLVLQLLRRYATAAGALLGALVFALHPLHTEAVANVVGQAELWSALAVLAACIVYVRRPEPEPGHLRCLAIAGLYAFGLLAKEHAVVLPGLLLLLDAADGRFPRARGDWYPYVKQVARPLTYLTVTLVLCLTVRIEVLGSLGGTDANPGLPHLRGEHRLLNAFRAWPEYVRLLFFPLDLSADYSPGVVLPVEGFTPMATFGLALLVGCVALMLATPWHPRPGLPAGFFFLALLPVANLLFPIGVLLAERTLYLPSIAAAFVAAFLWDAYAPRASTMRARRALAGAAAVALVLLAARTVIRNPDWNNTRAIMAAMLRDVPESYRSQWAAAVHALSENRDQDADRHWTLAYYIWPRDRSMLVEYASTELARDRPRHALKLLLEGRGIGETPRSIVPLALAYARLGMPDSLAATLQEGFRIIGPDPLLYELSARLAMDLDRPDRAVGAWRAAIHSMNPPSADQWRVYALALAMGGYERSALAALDTASLAAPSDTAALERMRRLVRSTLSESAAVSADPLQSAIPAAARPTVVGPAGLPQDIVDQ